MKLYKFITIAVLVVISLNSCNEGELLKEVPLDFYSPENSYTTPEGVVSGFSYIYYRYRSFFDGNYTSSAMIHSGTDMVRGARTPSVQYLGDYARLIPESGLARGYWNALYKIVADANTILGRIDAIPYSDENLKIAHVAEARFLRGYAYRTLAHLFGGVPLVLDEVKSPRRDFVRSTREETWRQAVEDFVFAANNLPDINSVEAAGRVSKAAANHVLAEVYLALKEWDKAIAAASLIIDDPNFSLMTSRFGKASDQDGDPFWDLFYLNNQNRNSGNKEGIWVLQTEFNIPGGNRLNHWETGFKWERSYGPLYWYIKDPEGVSAFIGPTTQNGGRPAGLVAPTDYAAFTIWEGATGDLRNHPRNIQRDWIVDNPASAWYGKSTSEFPKDTWTELNYERDYYPYHTKLTMMGYHPEELLADKESGLMQGFSGGTPKDHYLMRLAETYLLRAEAYLGKEQKELAANDINVVRARVNATPVEPSDVDIDYILDERMRELYNEDQRRMTLSRMNQLVRRTKAHNKYSGVTIKDYNELFPIPYNAIELNTEAELNQNPGYTN